MTANQLVALNLRRARQLRGLTQEEAAERLEPYLGKRWSVVTFSAAETSVTSKRVKEFSADELLAFSAAFGLPIAWFLVPPPEAELGVTEVKARGAKKGVAVASLIEAGGVMPLSAEAVQQVDEIAKQVERLSNAMQVGLGALTKHQLDALSETQEKKATTKRRRK